ncbi:uncharacterized protein LOC124818445 isoform X1 [Hydra vulgaris]|uniref:uncharacterized protein LOC124818445 isoform X1 n=2 Tax=Hydra vulgaris TaxID=6087 RepID=UPI0032EA1A1F
MSDVILFLYHLVTESTKVVNDIMTSVISNQNSPTQCKNVSNAISNENTYLKALSQIFVTLEQIKAQNDVIISNQMHQFAKQNMESGNVALPLLNNLQLPLETVDQLTQLDDLCKDCGTYSNLVKLLSKVGGSDEVDTTRRVMKRLISTKLACLLNWKGVCAKHGFGKLRLKSVVEDAVRQSPSSVNAKEASIEKNIQSWLRQAVDRDGGRQRRYEKSKSKQTTNILLP